MIKKIIINAGHFENETSEFAIKVFVVLRHLQKVSKEVGCSNHFAPAEHYIIIMTQLTTCTVWDEQCV